MMTYVCEVGNTATDEENLALWVFWGTKHEVEDSAGVVEGLGLSWCTRVLAVVGKLAGETGRGNGVGVDDRGTTTGNKGPDTTASVEDGQLERSTSLGVHLCNVGLLLGHLTTKGSRELHWWASIDGNLGVFEERGRKTESAGRTGDGPLDTAFEFGSLVKLCCEIEEVNFGRGGVFVGNDD